MNLHANIDWAVSYAPGEVIISGWAFNGATEGQHPFGLRVYYTANGQLLEAPVTVRYSGLRREDVAAAFPQYGQVNKFTGFTVVASVPSGDRTINLEWSDSLGAVYSSTVVVVQ